MAVRLRMDRMLGSGCSAVRMRRPSRRDHGHRRHYDQMRSWSVSSRVRFGAWGAEGERQPSENNSSYLEGGQGAKHSLYLRRAFDGRYSFILSGGSTTSIA